MGHQAGLRLFDELLGDEHGIEVFTDYLKSEYSEENMIVWTKVQSYKCMQNEMERHLHAQEIYDEHLDEFSSQSINIDSNTRQNTKEALKEGGRNVLLGRNTHI